MGRLPCCILGKTVGNVVILAENDDRVKELRAT